MQVFGESLGFQPGPQAREAEELGYDGLVAVDHFYSARPPAQPRWRVEPLVALGAAAATTSRIRLAAMVINTNFHHPAVIAHAIASLDRLSGGRAELGLGAGWYAPEHTAFGLPWGAASERVARLIECARVCRTMFERRGVISHRGRYFRLENTVPWDGGPENVVPVVIGGSRRALLCRGAEVANRIDVLHATVDGIPLIDEASGGSEGQLVELLEAVRARASAAGNSVKVSATLTAVVVGSGAGKATRGRLAAQYKTTEALLARDLLYVVGEQQELLEKIAVLAQLGVDRVHVIPGPVDQPRTAAALREMLSAIHEVRA